MSRDIRLEINGIRFSWNEDKAKANWKKHRIAFEAAAWAFFDPNAVDLRDDIHDEDEPRRNIIATIPTMINIAFVVYVECIDYNGEELIRIISARKANGKERKLYEQGLSR